MSTDIAGRVEASWQGLMDALEGIPEDRMSEPGVVGVWSVKDTMAHIAFWDDRAVAVQEAVAAERKPDSVDWRVKNDEVARERADWPIQHARREMHEAHGRVVEMLQKYPNANPEYLAGDTYDHYDEHAAEVRAWREREGL